MGFVLVQAPPLLLPLDRVGSHAGHLAAPLTARGSLVISLAAVAVHTLAMLAVTGVIAVAVYESIGLAFLRRGWIILDLLWALALVVTGLVLLGTPSH